MVDPPSAENRLSSTDANHSNVRWVDNKKAVFTVDLTAETTVHSQDRYIDSFLSMTASLQLGGWPSPANKVGHS